jgi:hypothetical protein
MYVFLKIKMSQEAYTAAPIEENGTEYFCMKSSRRGG